MAELKSPSGRFSASGIEEYKSYKASISSLQAELDKLKSQTLETAFTYAGRSTADKIRDLLRLKESEATVKQRLAFLDKCSLEDFAKKYKFKYPNFSKLSADAKFYGCCIKAIEAAKTDKLAVRPRDMFLVEEAMKKYIKENPAAITDESRGLPPEVLAKYPGNLWQAYVQAAQELYGRELCEKGIERPKHTALTKFFKNGFRDNYEEIAEILKYCKVNRTLGSLPPEWLKNIPREQLSAKTKQISQIFEKFAENANTTPVIAAGRKGRTFVNQGIKQDTIECMNKLQEELSQALGHEVKISFSGKGSYGSVFKIATADSALALKINHTTTNAASARSQHGITKELASGLFANKTEKNYAKIYLGRIGTSGDKDAFMLSRFIEDEKSGKTLSAQSEMGKLNPLRHTDIDTNGNVISGKIVDTGGITLAEEMKDKQQYKIYKMLLNTLTKNNGVSRAEQIKQACSKDVLIQKKYQNAVAYLDQGLKKYLPDINNEGYHTLRPVKKEVMEAIGVSNELPLNEVFGISKLKTETIDLIIQRYGLDKIRQHLSHNQEKPISEPVCAYLIEKGVKAKDLENNVKTYLGTRQYHKLEEFEQTLQASKNKKAEELKNQKTQSLPQTGSEAQPNLQMLYQKDNRKRA